MEKKKRYSVWSNFRYTFYHLRRLEGMGGMAACGGDVVMSILLPFLEAAFAGAVAAVLVSGKKPEAILLLVTGYVVLLQAARLLQSHLRQRRIEALFMYRGGMMTEFYRKILEMDGQSLESSEGQGKREAAHRNLFSGNDRGIEKYAQSYLEAFFNLGGLVLYGMIVGRRSLFLLAILTEIGRAHV